MRNSIIEPAGKPTAEYRDWDARYSAVVDALKSAMAPIPAFLLFEHVGSTAVPNCGGKGIIDLIALYRHGFLDRSKEFLVGTGFGRQGAEFSRAWPDDRPMFLGSFRWDEDTFTVYVHVIDEASDEVRRFREFRDRLAADSRLVAEYCSTKRRIIEEGVQDTDEYAVKKRSVIHKILGRAHALRKAAKPDI
jgi:GrpB-like predicted nucleotidyltransferase (UPF0157 family)